MAQSKCGVLVAGVVSTVTVDTNGDDVLVNNLDSSPDFTVIYCTIDGYAIPPTVTGGDNNFACAGTRVFANSTGQRQITLNLVCATSVAYSVEAVYSK